MAVRAVEAVARGIVQGVGFRWFAARVANDLGLSGWVANQDDGSVLLVAEGDARAIEDLLSALREGPAGAAVSGVEVRDLVATGAGGRFEIRAGFHRGD